MAVDERRRHEMYLAFEELLGAAVATTMMEHLPPVGWADVATKHDVEREVALIRADLDTKFARVDAGFADLRTEIARSSQRVLMWMIGIMLPAFAALFIATLAHT